MNKELKKKINELKELQKAAIPLMKFLQKKNPHSYIIVTNTKATLSEEQMSTGQLFDYLVD